MLIYFYISNLQSEPREGGSTRIPFISSIPEPGLSSEPSRKELGLCHKL